MDTWKLAEAQFTGQYCLSLRLHYIAWNCRNNHSYTQGTSVVIRVISLCGVCGICLECWSENSLLVLVVASSCYGILLPNPFVLIICLKSSHVIRRYLTYAVDAASLSNLRVHCTYKKARNTRTLTCVVLARIAHRIIVIVKLQILSEDDMNTLVMEDIVHHSQKFIFWQKNYLSCQATRIFLGFVN
jgi:hypothetical protein